MLKRMKKIYQKVVDERIANMARESVNYKFDELSILIKNILGV